VHIALNFLALVASLSAVPSQIPLVKQNLHSNLLPLPKIKATPSEQQALEKILKDANTAYSPGYSLIVFNPDPGDALPIRGWPLERFIATAKNLAAAFPEAFLVIIGLKRSRPFAQAFLDQIDAARCIDLTGRTPDLKSVVTLLELSRVLITNDSGPAHLAALTDVKSIVLYGPETPRLYGPLSEKSHCLFAEYSCSPCVSAFNHRYTPCNDNKCLQAISIEEVTARAKQAYMEAQAKQAANV
jgi:ADP-heptose:LPS heptosyltransferase